MRDLNLRWRAAAIVVCLLGAALCVPRLALAQTRGVGNAQQTLPRVAPPNEAKVSIDIDQTKPSGMNALMNRTITPTAIRIEGVKSIPFNDVSAHFTGFVGKPTTVKQLIDAAGDVTKLYQAAGYALSFAFIPTQDFANGVVRIVAVEGYVSTLTITGNAGNAERVIRGYGNHIVGERPLRRATFERYIALLGQLPGIKIAANVAPPQNTDGATALKLDIKRQRFNASTGISANQPGVQGLFTVTENGMLSLGEQLSVSALAPQGRNHVSNYTAGMSLPIGSSGLTARLDASRYRGQPDSTIGLPSILQRNVKQDKVGLTLGYPLILNNRQSLTLTGSAYAVSNEDRYTNKVNGANLGFRSQARVLQTELSWVGVTEKQTRRASINIAKGLDALGASKEGFTSIPNTSLSNPVDLDFFRVGGSAAQTNKLPFGFATVVSGTGQYSGQSLPTSEQITFGAQRYGLGYQPGEVSGDSGWAAAIEINREFAINLTYLKAFVPYVSYAIARTYLSKSTAPPARIASVAAGLRLSDSHYYALDLAVGLPVGDAPVENTSRSPRINATFSYQLY